MTSISNAALQRSSASACLRPAGWGGLLDRCRAVGITLILMLHEVKTEQGIPKLAIQTIVEVDPAILI